jgi:hypothetical protein
MITLFSQNENLINKFFNWKKFIFKINGKLKKIIHEFFYKKFSLLCLKTIYMMNIFSYIFLQPEIFKIIIGNIKIV